MSVVLLSRREAQDLAVIAQGLDRRPFKRRVRADDLMAVFETLGTIQLDTISVISRSHETVLWSRLGSYDRDLVPGLYAPGNALTEYLGHAASILPVDLLPLFRPYMETKARAHHGSWISEPENQAVMRAVLDRVAADGPMMSRDFEAAADAKRIGLWEWWGNKPERRALNALWVRGDLMIHQRDRGFARYFDLSERVAPGFWNGEAIPRAEQQRQLIRRAVRALGVTTAGWASDYFRTGGPSHVSTKRTREILREFETDGSVLSVDVPSIDEPVWMDAALQDRLARHRERSGRPTLTTLLSPFDNLIWNRPRGEQLWDFFYRLECYTPAPKRQYGYYSLPILHRGRIVGRLDPSFDRKNGVLTIKALHLEPWVKPNAPLAKAIAGAVEELLAFLGGDANAWCLMETSSPEMMELMRPYTGDMPGGRFGSYGRYA